MRDLRKTLHSLLAARHEATKLEDRFFKDISRLARTSPDETVPAHRTVNRVSSRRTLKCPRCSRRFARPLHLGPHFSATHRRTGRHGRQPSGDSTLDEVGWTFLTD
jgi:hypothetical protein